MVPKYRVDIEKDPPQLKKIIDDISQNLLPEIYSVSPNNVYSNYEKVTLKISGKNFVYGSSVRMNNIDKKTIYIGANELEAELTPADLSRDGEYYISVFSPILDGKISNSVKFIIASEGLKFSIIGILPVPIGDLAADKGNDGDGYASIGFGGFAELNYPVEFIGIRLGYQCRTPV